VGVLEIINSLSKHFPKRKEWEKNGARTLHTTTNYELMSHVKSWHNYFRIELEIFMIRIIPSHDFSARSTANSAIERVLNLFTADHDRIHQEKLKKLSHKDYDHFSRDTPRFILTPDTLRQKVENRADFNLFFPDNPIAHRGRIARWLYGRLNQYEVLSTMSQQDILEPLFTGERLTKDAVFSYLEAGREPIGDFSALIETDFRDYHILCEDYAKRDVYLQNSDVPKLKSYGRLATLTLCAMLQNGTGRIPHLTRDIAIALGEINDPRATPYLIKAYYTWNMTSLRSWTLKREVKSALFQAIRKINDVRARQFYELLLIWDPGNHAVYAAYIQCLEKQALLFGDPDHEIRDILNDIAFEKFSMERIWIRYFLYESIRRNHNAAKTALDKINEQYF